MAQLLFILVIIAIALGVYRCDGSETPSDASAPAQTPQTRLEQTLQTPQRAEQAIKEQMDSLNQRNQEMLDRY